MATTVTPSGPPTNGMAADGAIALLGVGAAMDLGGRANQEDALGVFFPADEAQARRGNLCVLADGLGGHSAGDLASRLAVQSIGAAYYASPMRQPGNLLHSAIEQANRRIVAAGQEPAHNGLGSTCVCVAVQGDMLWVANVGDSRAYLLRSPGGLQQLTQDDSLAAEQVRRGLIPPGATADSSMQAMLLQALGTASGVQPHFAGPVRLQKGDLLVLCSDGLYNALDERAMQDYLLAALQSNLDVNPEQLAHDLVEGARFRGAEDNISALVVACGDVVPEAVARAAGWPQQQARSLFLPADGPATSDEPSPADRGLRNAEAVVPGLHPAGAGSPAGLAMGALGEAPILPGAGGARVPALTVAALVLAVVLLVVLAGAWLWAVLTGSRLVVPIFLALAGVALTTLALLISRPWARAVPAPLAPVAPAEPLPSDTTRGLLAAESGDRGLDPLALLITHVLPGAQSVALAADRGSPAPPPAAPAAADVDYVSQAMTEALSRARQQWIFNLLIAAVSASLVIGGCILTAVLVPLGQTALPGVLFGPGVGLLGIVSWLVTQPAAQLNRADNQISLLTIVWTNYAQELRSCARLGDPAGVAACNARAGAEAVQYFNQIVGENKA